MNSRPVNHRARRQWTAFSILLVTSLVLMGISRTRTASDLESGFNYAMEPAVTWLDGAADAAGSYWSAVTQIDKLRTDNDDLRQENEKLREELARMPAISQLSTDWTKISEAQQSVPYGTTPARVIGRDLSGVRARTFILDIGSNDGIAVNQVVMSAGGALVGTIEAVDTTVSQVLLLNDPKAVVIGKESQSGAMGAIQGQVGGILRMSNVDTADTLDKGAIVVTAGESIPGTDARSPYPPGLLIGQIVSIAHDPNAVVQTCYLNPTADFLNINYVLVITGYKGGIPLGTPPVRSSPTPGSSSSSSPSASASAASNKTPKPSPTP